MLYSRKRKKRIPGALSDVSLQTNPPHDGHGEPSPGENEQPEQLGVAYKDLVTGVRRFSSPKKQGSSEKDLQ